MPAKRQDLLKLSCHQTHGYLVHLNSGNERICLLHQNASFIIDTVGKLQENVSISSVKTELFQYQSNLIAFVLGYANC